MIKCNNCGQILEDSEQPTHKESRGKCGDESVYETMDSWCWCGGEFEEAYQCKICGEWFTEGELTNEICDDCINSAMTVENAVAYAENGEQSINEALVEIVGSERINEIISAILTEFVSDNDRIKAKKFCNEHKYEFSEWLEEQNK